MSTISRRDTMDDTELTVLALEIMHDLHQLSTVGNVDPSDQYIFNFNRNHIDNDIDDEIMDEILSHSHSQSEDEFVETNTDYNTLYNVTESIESIHDDYPITIISSSSMDSLNTSLPPIPSPKKQIKATPISTITTVTRHSSLKINIPGNKQRGIKRWTKKHKNRSRAPSTSESNNNNNNNNINNNNTNNNSNDYCYSSPSNNISPSYSRKTETSHSTAFPSNVFPIYPQQNNNNNNNNNNPSSIDKTSCILPIKPRECTQSIRGKSAEHNNNNKGWRKYHRVNIANNERAQSLRIDTKKKQKKHKKKKKKKKKRNKKKKEEKVEINDNDIMDSDNNSLKEPLPYFVKRKSPYNVQLGVDMENDDKNTEFSVYSAPTMDGMAKTYHFDYNNLNKKESFSPQSEIDDKCKKIKKRKKKRKSRPKKIDKTKSNQIGSGLRRKRDGIKKRNKARSSSITSSMRYNNDDNYDENEYAIEVENGFIFINNKY